MNYLDATKMLQTWMLNHIPEPHDSKKFRPDIERRLDQSLAFMHSNFDNNKLNGFDMADAIHLSKYHFVRLFKRKFGTTPYQYLTGIRIEAAKKLLRSSPFSISYIVIETGFLNRSSFSRLFKNCVGMTSSAYRKKFTI